MDGLRARLIAQKGCTVIFSPFVVRGRNATHRCLCNRVRVVHYLHHFCLWCLPQRLNHAHLCGGLVSVVLIAWHNCHHVSQRDLQVASLHRPAHSTGYLLSATDLPFDLVHLLCSWRSLFCCSLGLLHALTDASFLQWTPPRMTATIKNSADVFEILSYSWEI